MSKTKEPKITYCPSPVRQDYRPHLATRIAIAKAQREQPPLVSLASNVPSHRIDGG